MSSHCRRKNSGINCQVVPYYFLYRENLLIMTHTKSIFRDNPVTNFFDAEADYTTEFFIKERTQVTGIWKDYFLDSI